MPKKGKKKKGPAIYTDPTHLDRFSLAVNEIIKTPLGVTGTVCGVKYATAEQAATFSAGKVWVKYENGLEAPVDYEPAHGYTKGTAADHIHRDVQCYNDELERMIEKRKQEEEEMRLRALGIESPTKEKGKKSGKKKKK
eukprot:jgi/Ulvmu1/7038/UM033_0097.1